MSLLTPTRLFKCLSDDTRLVLMLLIHAEGELCVCEMTYVLQESQPKVSRHLAQCCWTAARGNGSITV